MRWIRVVSMCVLASCATSVDTRREQLIVLNTAVPWTTNTNHTVPICFVTPQQLTPGGNTVVLTGQAYLEARLWFRYALERAWPAVSWIDPSGFNACPTTGTDRFVRFVLTNGGGGQTNVGMNGIQNVANGNFPLPTAPFDATPLLGPNVVNPGFNVSAIGTANQTPGQNDFALLVAHETGHLMGWQHEQDSPNNVNVNWCSSPSQPWISTALTSLDTQSIMSWSYCANDHCGLSDLDIEGARQIYGARPESADSDHDGVSDLIDNCPFVYNKDQSDKNWDAELTVAIRDHQRTGVNNDEGHIPVSGDPQWYKDYWHGWYAGDACDTTGVTGATPQSFTSHIQTQAGCTEIYAGGITSVTYSQFATCSVFLQDTQLDEDSTISSPTGFRDPETGVSQPAACYCGTAVSNKAGCANPITFNCQFANDAAFPVSGDSLHWYRLTTERDNNGWSPTIAQQISTTFQPPIPGSTPSTTSLLWNPFYAQNGWTSDVQRMLGSTTTSLPAVIWTSPRWISTTQPPNLPNNYIGVAAKLPGKTIHWVPPFAPKWKPVAWLGKLKKKVVGGIRFGAVSQDGAGHGVMFEQNTDGALIDASFRLSPGAIEALALVGSGSVEMLVADDDVANGSRISTKPSVLLVDAGTTRIRGALTPTTGEVSYVAAPALPLQSTTNLRAHANEAGKLYSLEGANLWARDVTAALSGTSSGTFTPITGVVPSSPVAIVWSQGQQRLLVLDEINTAPRAWKVRLLSITAGGVSTQLWITQQFSGSMLPSAGYLSLGGYGEVIVSLDVTGGYHEVMSMRADDGQPLQSYRGAGTLHAAAVSDGASFTIPRSVTPTETQPNMTLTYVPRGQTTVGVCAASWFKNRVGDQTGLVLGNPSVDCQ